MRNKDTAYLQLMIRRETRIKFNNLKKYNGWTADFFLSRLLDFWESTKLEDSQTENVKVKELKK